MTQSKPFVGGGCRSYSQRSKVKAALPLTVGEITESIKKGRADESIVRFSNNEEAARQSKREEQRLAEEQKQRLWGEQFDALKQPPVGSVVSSSQYVIRISTHPEREGQISAHVLLRVGGEYPHQPFNFLGNQGRWGLKVFLDQHAIDYLCWKYPEIIEAHREAPQQSEYIECDLPMKILNYSNSKKSARGTLIF